MTKTIKGLVNYPVIAQHYHFKRGENSKISGHGKRLLFSIKTGTDGLANIAFSGSCPIEGGDEVQIRVYEKKVRINGDKYYEAKEIHQFKGGKVSRIDHSVKESE